MNVEYIVSVLKIIAIDIVLSGDNAVVIAMAARKLPAQQRKQAILWGGGIAIFLRIVFTLVMAFLLMVPLVRLIGGFVLVYIACKLLLEEDDHVETPGEAAKSALAAIRMIFVADFVMSLDNMLAVAGASHGDWLRLLMGLLVSIVIIMTCSAVIAWLMGRYKWIVYLGAAILALTAGEMMLGDREVAALIVRDRGVLLDSHWNEWMLTKETVKQFPGEEKLPAELRESMVFRAHRRSPGGELTFIGQMTETQRDKLLEIANDDESLQRTFEKMYDETRERPVPPWAFAIEDACRRRLPAQLVPDVRLWFQRKWPAEYWNRIQGHNYWIVRWVFCAVIILICLSSPKWWPRRKEKIAVQPVEKHA